MKTTNKRYANALMRGWWWAHGEACTGMRALPVRVRAGRAAVREGRAVTQADLDAASVALGGKPGAVRVCRSPRCEASIVEGPDGMPLSGAS